MHTIQETGLDAGACTAGPGGVYHPPDISSGAFEHEENMAAVLRHVFSGGDLRCLDEEQMSELLERLLKWGLTDELTGLPNRRMFTRRMKNEHRRSHRTEREFAVVLLDLDHFKEVNDLYGHQEGDRILRQVAGTVRRSLRETDFLARYGGEEFCAILPETSQKAGARVAERARRAVRELDSPAPTISLGVAAWRPWLGTDELMARADRALYGAKKAGRDRVEQYDERPVSLSNLRDPCERCAGVS